MKKVSVLLIIVGIIVTIGLIIYFRSVVNPVDSDAMTIDRSGSQVSEWPLFIGIIFTFVGTVFYYVSHTEKNAQ
jgi:amino acid transporter